MQLNCNARIRLTVLGDVPLFPTPFLLSYEKQQARMKFRGPKSLSSSTMTAVYQSHLYVPLLVTHVTYSETSPPFFTTDVSVHSHIDMLQSL